MADHVFAQVLLEKITLVWCDLFLTCEDMYDLKYRKLELSSSSRETRSFSIAKIQPLSGTDATSQGGLPFTSQSRKSDVVRTAQSLDISPTDQVTIR